MQRKYGGQLAAGGLWQVGVEADGLAAALKNNLRWCDWRHL
jgi:hypothetical protein